MAFDPTPKGSENMGKTNMLFLVISVVAHCPVGVFHFRER
jgi:hypothetical protein